MKVSAFFQMWLVAVSGLLSAGNAEAIALGPIQGEGVVGQPLRLSSKVTQLNPDQLGQLKEACLKAHIRPHHVSDGLPSQLAQEAMPLRSQFVRLGSNSGEVFFDGPALNSDVSFLLTLESHCPLSTFEYRWTVFLEPHQAGSGAASLSTAPPEITKPRQFDVQHSRLLSQSRQQPKSVQPGVASNSPRGDTHVVDLRQHTAPATHAAAGLETPPAMAQPDKVALLDVPPESPETSLVAPTPPMPKEGGLWSSTGASLLALFGLMAAAVLGVLIWMMRRARLASARPMPLTGLRSAPVLTSTREVNSHAEREDKDPAGHIAESANRVLESFYTPDGPNYLDTAHEVDEKPFDGESIADESVALTRTLGVLQRAGMPKWNLPDTYLSLVTSRNAAAEASTGMELQTLQCQLGLVELAFQEASRGRILTRSQSAELLVSILGDDFASCLQSEWPTLPDIVRTYVRAKFCEISGAERRKLFKVNLTNLVEEPPAGKQCFDRSLWLELLAEQGLVNA
ncbi:MAG TPA: hypothetical protein VFV57_12050 [Limnobacter sp.]|nr:hypothetical protein [Limnobacter sp.]